eukprot:4783943-Prymnesium_polylepis.1
MRDAGAWIGRVGAGDHCSAERSAAAPFVVGPLKALCSPKTSTCSPEDSTPLVSGHTNIRHDNRDTDPTAHGAQRAHADRRSGRARALGTHPAPPHHDRIRSAELHR